ncbi:MAG: hypothetical protein H7Y59_15215 [Anaerolineales bacterium]|nr:hypothetical protein [Anaerolineales bacterium]
MNKRSIFVYMLILAAMVLVAFQSVSAVNAAPYLQDDPTPVVGVTVVLPGETAAPEQVPVTGGVGMNTVLIIGVLMIAGVAFLLALVALMRRPSA